MKNTCLKLKTYFTVITGEGKHPLEWEFAPQLVFHVLCRYLKGELIGTNAYKLQASLSEKVVVDGHGCHTRAG